MKCQQCGITFIERQESKEKLMEQQITHCAAIIEQQAQEIKRLQTREHRMIEYMRDVKNFAFTINEVATNAIEESEVAGND